MQVHSHTYDTADIPSAKFTYDLSPIQILVSEKHRAWYASIVRTLHHVLLCALLYVSVTSIKRACFKCKSGKLPEPRQCLLLGWTGS